MSAHLLAVLAGAALGAAACVSAYLHLTRYPDPCPCAVRWCKGCCVSEHGDACDGDHEPVPSWTWTPW